MNKLDEIISFKKRSLSNIIRPIKAQELEKIASLNKSKPSLYDILSRNDKLSVIAEIKRKSPSSGIISEGIKASDQAIKYVNANADALSVLTDLKYFGGSLKDLWEVTDLIKQHQKEIPCLRKDFMVHPIQVLEAAEAGAKCILIIVSALNHDEISYLKEAAYYAQLDIIYEIHDLNELEIALQHQPDIIGVNNRDLKSFKTNLSVSEEIIPNIPKSIIKISESGIYDLDDASRAKDSGADAILVGEALMQSKDPEELIKTFHLL